MVAGCGSSGHHTKSAGLEQKVSPTTAPSDVRWTEFDGVPVPLSSNGPTQAIGDGGVAAGGVAGYTHNGPGGAMAAINATVRMSIANDAQWVSASQMLAAGPGRDNWVLARARLSITTPVPAGKAPRVLGYTLDSYTGARETISIIVRQSDSSLTSQTAEVAWAPPGDWKLVVPDQHAPAARPAVHAIAAVPPQMITVTPAAS